MQHADPINSDLETGSRIGGYTVEKIVEIPEVAAIYYELSHHATGASHIHISRPDSENVFAVILKTVPRDSTGIAHILEHTALCGSARYPVKDPFFSMMKRSLNTFMNALTASDWTMYPFATQNKNDYYNLMSVYLDSVFHPRLDRLSFMQEGHRVEVENDPDNPGKERLVYKGVVYNEMKGAMSSPDQVMGRSILNALYPDTTYSFNSGGSPEEIPKLTHQDLLAFHHHHYHPSNAFFYTYGDFPLRDHLDFIEIAILSDYTQIDPETMVPSQPRWSSPGKVNYFYPADPAESNEKRSQVCVAWLGPDIRDAFEVLVMTVMEQVLLGNPGSPLRKALIDSGLGSTLSDGSGYDSENKDTMFACGLKDVSIDSADEIQTIIFDVLNDLSEKGVDRRLVETALHQIEFHRKEVSNVPYPYGLKMLLRFCGDWIHQGDPAGTLKFDALLERFHHELEKGGLLENRIRKYLIENTHRALVTLEPDVELSRARDEQEKERLEKLRMSLTGDDIEKIRQDAERLVARQDETEDLSCLPTLKLGDVSPDIHTVSETDYIPNYSMYRYEQPVSGIFYYTSVMGLNPLPLDLVPLVPFFCHAITRIGTKDFDYVEMARRIDQYTGSMHLSVSASNSFRQEGDQCMPFVNFSGKSLSRNREKMLEIIEAVLCDYSFSDLQRLKTLLLEVRSGLESSVVRNGHRYAISLASRNFSSTSALNEVWHGIHHLKNIKELTEDLTEEKLQSISENLTRIAGSLFHKNNIQTALIAEKEDLEATSGIVGAIYNKLPYNPDAGFSHTGFSPGDEIPFEGWATSSAVSFVARVIETSRMTHRDAPALAILSKLLKSMYLHREIREKGGAYGGFSAYQLESGLFSFGSYRDPHIENTLQVYDSAGEFIRSDNYTEDDIIEAILQVCADFDHPDPPQNACRRHFYYKLIGLADDMRREFKAALLKARMDTIREAGDRYFAPDMVRPSGVAVISSEEMLNAANEKLGGKMKIHRI